MEAKLMGRVAGLARGGVRPGVGRAFVVAFRSPVTDVLGEAAGMPLAVIAATADPGWLRRTLSETWHAAWYAAPQSSTDPFRRGDVEASDVRYEEAPFRDEALRGQALPQGMFLRGGRLHVALPAGASAADLNEFIGLALDDRRFDVLARDPSAVRRRHAAGHAADLGPRYARRPGGRTVTLVRNLYAFETGDLRDLVRAVELASHGLAARCCLAPSNVCIAGRSR